MADARTLVTGGAGFIGSHLVDRLVADGREVVVLDDLSTGLRERLAPHGDRVRFIEGDVADPTACRDAMDGVREVFHLASRVSVVESVDRPDLYRAVVLEGTRHVLKAAVAASARRVVLASSCSVYGDAEPPVSEDATVAPMSPYAAMKLEAERVCRDHGRRGTIETVCPRFFNVYGPRQRSDSPYSGVVSIFADLAKAGRTPTIFGDGRQTRDFIFVRDVVEGLHRAMASPRVGGGEAVNFGTGSGTSVLEVARLLGGGEPRFEPARAGEIRHSRADVSRAVDLLGFRAGTSLATGLATLRT